MLNDKDKAERSTALIEFLTAIIMLYIIYMIFKHWVAILLIMIAIVFTYTWLRDLSLTRKLQSKRKTRPTSKIDVEKKPLVVEPPREAEPPKVVEPPKAVKPSIAAKLSIAEYTASDELFIDAGRYCIQHGKASIGVLQREFKIGFNRASRIMDELCEAGVASKEDGTKPREILISADDFEDYVKTGKFKVVYANDARSLVRDENMTNEELQSRKEEIICNKPYNAEEEKRESLNAAVDRLMPYLSEYSRLICERFANFGIIVSVVDIYVENGNFVFGIKPMDNTRVREIKSYQKDVSLWFAAEVQIEMVAEKGIIGIFVPIAQLSGDIFKEKQKSNFERA